MKEYEWLIYTKLIGIVMTGCYRTLAVNNACIFFCIALIHLQRTTKHTNSLREKGQRESKRNWVNCLLYMIKSCVPSNAYADRILDR